MRPSWSWPAGCAPSRGRSTTSASSRTRFRARPSASSPCSPGRSGRRRCTQSATARSRGSRLPTSMRSWRGTRRRPCRCCVCSRTACGGRRPANDARHGPRPRWRCSPSAAAAGRTHSPRPWQRRSPAPVPASKPRWSGAAISRTWRAGDSRTPSRHTRRPRRSWSSSASPAGRHGTRSSCAAPTRCCWSRTRSPTRRLARWTPPSSRRGNGEGPGSRSSCASRRAATRPGPHAGSATGRWTRTCTFETRTPPTSRVSGAG